MDLTRTADPLRRHWPLLSLVALTGVITLLASTGSGSIRQAGTGMLINLVLVVGLFTFVGNSGLFSFGHTAFMAIGAYVTALLAMPTDIKEFLLPELPDAIASIHLPAVQAIVAGALAASLAAAVIGLPIVRMEPLPASLATFGVLAIVYNVAQNLNAVGGSTGLGQVPVSTTLGGALVWALLAICAAYAYGLTRSCLRLRASREDEVAARSIGVPVVRDRYVSFVLSGLIAGAAGGLYALNLGFFTPSAFFLNAAFLSVIMLLIGGMTSLAGAVVGTIAVSIVQEILRRAEGGFSLAVVDVPARPGLQNVVLALLFVVIMIKRPLGIVGGREIQWPFRPPSAPSALSGELEPGAPPASR